MDYQVFADNIVDLVGGQSNVLELEHCVTRLRFVLKDEGRAQTDAIKKLDGVMSVVQAAGQYQVVVGGEVVPMFNAIRAAYSFGDGGNAKVSPSKERPNDVKGWAKYLWDSLIGYLSGTMVQIIPLFIGCGLINCILSAATLFFGLNDESSTYSVLYSIANAPFYFLPVLVGFAAAKKLKCNVMLGALLGLILLHPSFTALTSTEGPVEFFGIPLQAISYSTAVFPTLFGAWVLSKVEPVVYGAMPKVVRSVFGPFMCALIMSLLMFFIIGPLGYYFGQMLANVVLGLSALPFGIGCGVVSALQSVLVLFGAHTVLAPIMIEGVARGGDVLVRPAFIMASFGLFGAILAVTLKLKDKDLKSGAAGCCVTQFLGTSEPAIYGYLLPLFKPFVCGCTGAFAGGVVASLLGATAYAMGKNGVFGWLVFQETVPAIIIASAVSAVVGFVLVWLTGFDENALKE